MITLLFVIIFIISILLYKLNLLILASILMLAFSLFSYFYEVKKTKNFVNLKALYSLGFLGSFSLSYLKLSNLSTDYSIKFFLVIFIAVISFYFSYDITHLNFNKKLKSNITNADYKSNINKTYSVSYVYKFLLITMAISFISFLIEVYILKFVPLFVKNVPHAYSTFHVFMLHYLTTLYIFVPSIAIIYLYYEIKSNNLTNIIKLRVIIAILYAIVISTLLVSRGQLLMSFVMAMFTYIILFFNNYKIGLTAIYNFSKKHIKVIFSIIIVFILLYLLITIRRSHSVSYLNDIFDMKDKNLPIFITQPYMYLTEGFENLNYMIQNITDFSFGKRSLQPLFTFTFMNKLFYFDFIYEYFLLKPELTNMTLYYDAYADFSIFGVILLSVILGFVSSMLDFMLKYKNEETKNPIAIIFYVLIGYYLLMSFFQPFFSLASSTLYILYILLFYIIF